MGTAASSACPVSVRFRNLGSADGRISTSRLVIEAAQTESADSIWHWVPAICKSKTDLSQFRLPPRSQHLSFRTLFECGLVTLCGERLSTARAS